MEPADRPDQDARSPRADRAGWVLIALGLVGILWGVLHMSSKALGGAPPRREFAYRRSYDQVKTDAHAAFPGFLLRGGTGFVLLIVGAGLRARRGDGARLKRPRARE